MDYEQARVTERAAVRFDEDGPAEGPSRLSEVASAQEQVDQACQPEMLGDRLVNYLRAENPEKMTGELVDREAPVPAAAELGRYARVINGVADRIGDLRDRFEG